MRCVTVRRGTRYEVRWCTTRRDAARCGVMHRWGAVLCDADRRGAACTRVVSENCDAGTTVGAQLVAADQDGGDLEQLTRMSVELFGAAFGVPSDLLFSGRFASKSTAQ